jgi:hypothetical protein
MTLSIDEGERGESSFAFGISMTRGPVEVIEILFFLLFSVLVEILGMACMSLINSMYSSQNRTICRGRMSRETHRLLNRPGSFPLCRRNDRYSIRYSARY